MYANQQMEQLNREHLEALQLDLLKKQLRWAEEKSVFYRAHFARAGVSH